MRDDRVRALGAGVLAVVIGVGCGSTSTNAGVAEGAERLRQVNEMTAALTGVWERTLHNGERERLTLFESNTMALNRSGELPISRTVGRWFVRDGQLDVDIASCEGNCGDQPALAPKLAVRHQGNTLHLIDGNDETTWTRIPHPYGTSAGARERELRDEIQWTYMLGVAVGKAQADKTTATATPDAASP